MTKVCVPGPDGEDPTWRPYQSGYEFTSEEVPVPNIRTLADVLAGLADDPYAAVIRGTRLPEYVGAGEVRRLFHKQADGTPATMMDCPRSHVMIDVDKGLCLPKGLDVRDDPLACARYVVEQLATQAPELLGVSCVVQWSSRAGMTPGGAVKAHVWYILDRPHDCAELAAWADWRFPVGGTGVQIDHALYRPVQLHYVARPVFVVGIEDPLPGQRRMGLVPGTRDVLRLPSPPQARTATSAPRDLPPLTDDELRALAPPTTSAVGLIGAQQHVDQLARATSGVDRHIRARECARRMGWLVAAGDLSLSEAWQYYLSGAHACALDRDPDENLTRTFRDGLRFGVREALARRQGATRPPQAPAPTPVPPPVASPPVPAVGDHSVQCAPMPPPVDAPTPAEVSPAEKRRLMYDKEARAAASTLGTPSPGAPPHVELLPGNITTLRGPEDWLLETMARLWQGVGGAALAVCPPRGRWAVTLRRQLGMDSRDDVRHLMATMSGDQRAVISIADAHEVPETYTPKLLVFYGAEAVYSAICGRGLPRRTGGRAPAPEAYAAVVALAERVQRTGGAVLLADPYAGGRTNWCGSMLLNRDLGMVIPAVKDIAYVPRWGGSPVYVCGPVEDELDRVTEMARTAEELMIVVGSTMYLRALAIALTGVPGVVHYDRTPSGDDLAQLRDPGRWSPSSRVRVALVDLRVADEMVQLDPSTHVARVVLIADRSPGRSWQSLVDALTVSGAAGECHVWIAAGRWDGRSLHHYAIERDQDERIDLALRGVSMGGAPCPPWDRRFARYACNVGVETRQARLDGRIPADCVLSYLAARGATLVQTTVTRDPPADETDDQLRAASRRTWKHLASRAAVRRARRVAAAPMRILEQRTCPRTSANVDSREHTRLVDLYGANPTYTSRTREMLDDGEGGEPLTGMVGLAHDDETGRVTRTMHRLTRYCHGVSGDAIGCARDDRRALGTGAYVLADATTTIEMARWCILSHPQALGAEWAARLGRPPAVTLLPDGTMSREECDTSPPPEWHSHHPCDDPRPEVMAQVEALCGNRRPVRALGITEDMGWARWVGVAMKGIGYRTVCLGQRRMTDYDNLRRPQPGDGKAVRVYTVDVAHMDQHRRLAVVIVARSFGATVEPLGGAETAWQRAVDPETGMWRRVTPEQAAWPGELLTHEEGGGARAAPPPEAPAAAVYM
jgi:hypothetical protein